MNENNKLEYVLEGLGCANCAMKIEGKVQELKYVKEASLNFATKKLIIESSESVEKTLVTSDVKSIVSKIEPDVKVVEKVKNTRRNDLNKNANSVGKHHMSHDNGDGHEHHNEEDEHAHGQNGMMDDMIRFGIAFVLFLIPLLFKLPPFIRFSLYFISYIISGGEVIIRAIKNIRRGEIFDENFLMAIATVGAFIIGEYPEGVAVMIFYQIGEMFQDFAVERSRKSIAGLMDIRPDYANLKVDNEVKVVDPEDIHVGDIILVKPGEKVPLDGIIIEGNSLVDTRALTGESLPRDVFVGDSILSGYINTSGLLTVKVEKEFHDSTVAKILDMVENASNKKASTEKFITKFAKVYTPIVTISALLLAILPPIILPGATFSEWIYRALVFLVVSCPCALVVSIPLGFFGGIGGASKNGILVKGSNYLELLNSVKVIVFDKTGTLTKGVFHVTQMESVHGTKEQLLEYAAYAESYSNHPIATSIVSRYGKDIKKNEIKEYNEIPGHGIKVNWNGIVIVAGNHKLMDREGIDYEKIESIGTMVHIGVNGVYQGYIIISDEIKEDSKEAIQQLKSMGIDKMVMLTGDNKKVGEQIGKELGMDEVYSELLPDQKVEKLEEIIGLSNPKDKVMFVGDGINDAPVLALSDIGVAMGGLGSDAAIEAADVVLMTDEPSKIIGALQIAKKTRTIVWQNIMFAFTVKILVLILGAGGLATMWEAVFADVGVALIAVLNAMRAMRMK